MLPDNRIERPAVRGATELAGSLLPYLEQQPLHERFNFNVPWDHSDNLPLLDSMPDVLKCPNLRADDTNTVYLAVVGLDDAAPVDETIFYGDPPRSSRIRDILDGTTNVIMNVEADLDQAVPWTKPDDWRFDPQNPRRGLGNLRRMGFLALLADGSVRFIPADLDDQTVRYLMSRNDGNPIAF